MHKNEKLQQYLKNKNLKVPYVLRHYNCVEYHYTHNKNIHNGRKRKSCKTNCRKHPFSTLFRFVSLRSPQLSDEKDQNRRFILIPEDFKNDETFYVPVTTGAGSKQKLLKQKASDFESNPDRIENTDYIRNNFQVLYDFAVWAARNKNSCTYQEFIDKKEEVFASHNIVYPDLIKIWNNLIYQIVTQGDFYLKEALMQILSGMHLLQTSENNEDEARILLSAKVVIPKELMLDKQILPSSQSMRKTTSDQPQETFPTEEMRRQQELSTAQMKLVRIDSLSKDLHNFQKQYEKDYHSEYKVQRENYEKEIAPALEKYNDDVQKAKDDYCGTRPPGTEYNPNDPCQQPKDVPYPKIRDFEFDFRDEVSADMLIRSLKQESIDTLLDVLGYQFDPEKNNKETNNHEELANLLQGKNTFAELSSEINTGREKNNNIIIENSQGSIEAYSSIGGIIIPVSRTISIPFTYQLCTKLIYKFYNLNLAINVPDSSWDISGVSYALIYDNGNVLNGSYFVKSRSGNTIYLNDLLQQGVEFSMIQDSDFDIKIHFTNGKMAQFRTLGISVRTCSSGVFELKVEEGEPPVIEDEENNFIPTGFGFKNIGIADYLKVEQSTHAYIEGEVANIENIMAREYREKSTRRLRRSENTTTSSSDTEREQLTDTTTANRYEMQNEIAKMMQEATDIGVSANTHLGFGKNYTLDLGASYANHRSKEESTRQAVTESQDITARAMDRIVTKVHEERIEKIIDEFEENNSHGFDNRKGDKHVVGVYRWVDKLMKNQIYNYGKRMMFEFMIPEPAKLHLLGVSTDKSVTQTTLIKPEDPRAEGALQISDYSKLADETKLKYWVSKYNVELDERLPDKISVGKSFDHYTPENDKGTSKSADIKIPTGYQTESATVSFNGMGAGGSWDRIVLVTVGTANFFSVPGRTEVSKPQELAGYVESIPITFAVTNFYTANASVDIKCKLTQETKNIWLQKAFKSIIDGYEEALADYNTKLAEEQDKAKTIKDSNPTFYRQIENTILRKNCISYMSDRAVGSTHGLGLSGLTQGTTFKDYETSLTAKLDKYTAFVKFMEQAFEWENISYYLYPYYWGDKQNWLEIYQKENTDPTFRAFLQSGMARVIATVRPGFEDAVQFYLATGKIWNGGEVPVIGDELYLSIVDEMKEPKGIKQGKAWLTRLPTTLNILQAESIGLKVAHALPFTTENPDDFEVPSEVITEEKFNFVSNDNLLGVQNGDNEKIISGDWL